MMASERTQLLVDAGIAAGFAALSVSIVVGLVDGPAAVVGSFLAVAHWAPLVVRRRYPLAVLGTMIAFALGRHRFRGRSSTNLLIFMPMATPEVVMGSSLLTLFLMMGLPAGGLAITIAHIMFCISFVVVAVKARVATLDPRLEEAAADLGANAFHTFVRITLPLAAPGIAAGALLAFSLMSRRKS